MEENETNSFTGGLYFSQYSWNELWHWNNILLEVRDNPRMLDLTLTNNSGDTYQGTQNGFTQYGTLHAESKGTATILAGYVGDEWQATEKLCVDVGARLEKSVFRGRGGGFNGKTINIDGEDNTLYDNGVAVSDNDVQAYNQSETEWALSGGLNYSISEQYAVFGRFSRGFHMPDLDDIRGGRAEVDVTEVLQGELGVKSLASRSTVPTSVFSRRCSGVSCSIRPSPTSRVPTTRRLRRRGTPRRRGLSWSSTASLATLPGT